jgi:GT2 family glycosyltransferase
MPWIERCFGSLQNSETPLLTVAIDNGSTDGTVEFIKQHFPKIVVIENRRNLGFAKANNIGMKYALNHGADYVFLLNHDAWIERDTVTLCLETFKKNAAIGIVSPLHLNGTKTGYDKLFAINCLTEEFFEDEKNDCLKDFYIVPKSNAAAWLIDTRVIRKIGGFDTLLFTHYGEDSNYYQRLAYHGFKLAVCSQTTICHDRADRIANGNERGIWEKYRKITGYKIYAADINDEFNMKRAQINNFKESIKMLLSLLFRGFLNNVSMIFTLLKIGISRNKNKQGGLVWL